MYTKGNTAIAFQYVYIYMCVYIIPIMLFANFPCFLFFFLKEYLSCFVREILDKRNRDPLKLSTEFLLSKIKNLKIMCWVKLVAGIPFTN